MIKVIHIFSSKNNYRVVLKLVFFILFPLQSIHSDGLPGEYLISDQWRSLFWYHSPLTNPALLTEYPYASVRGVNGFSADAVARLWEVGATYPIGLFQGIGCTWVIENGLEVSNGFFDGDEYVATQEPAHNDNMQISLSYGNNIWRKLSVGATIHTVYQSNFGDPRLGLGADVGASYRLLFHPLFGYHLLGINYQNILSPDVSLESDMKNSAQIQTLYRATFLQNKIEFDFRLDITDFTANKDFFLSNKRSFEWDIASQIGVWPLPFIRLTTFTEFGDSKNIEYLGFACGLNAPNINSGRDLLFTYQYRNDLTSDLFGSHSLYFLASIGRHREEFRAKHIARIANITPNELYNKAMKLYSKGNYWDAFFIFSRILVDFPDFFKNDMVGYYAGSCLEELDMREHAIIMYNRVKENFPRSSAVPFADLGLMRIYYRQNNFDAVQNQFVALNRPLVPDSIRYHGNYIMGETELQKSDYRLATHNFGLIPEHHPTYVFAQHSSATSHILMDEINPAISNLENCISVKVKTKAENEIINRSYLHLGYIFYEMDALSKAIIALRMVPPESYYYEDALLGMGWTAIKARQWNDCISAGAKLSELSDKAILRFEGALVQSYGNLLNKTYKQALNIATNAVEAIQKVQPLSEDTMYIRKFQYESDSISYSFLAEKTVGLARKGGKVHNIPLADSLHTEQINTKQKLDNFIHFCDDYKRTTFFERTLTKVKEDLEYASATIQKVMQSSKINAEKEKFKSKEDKISSEIDKLKEEMERLENP